VFAPRPLALAVCLAVLLPACRRESLEAARDRAADSLLTTEIADLESLIAKAETGQLVTRDRIAIGVAEETVKALLDASLPQEQTLGDRVQVQLRVEAAQPFFRGNNAALVFQARARGVKTGATARLELGGRLVNFRIDKGRLTAGVALVHFKVLETSLHEIASDALERLLRENPKALARLMPGLEVPVHLEPSIDIPGLAEGPVVTRGGVLPFEMTLAEVIPVGQRLWMLLDVKAGPWRRAGGAEARP
jgi:hypothetical protein